ncbi:MAG: HD domain-containing protein [Synergistaceae bacterium]|nr:HD domain-containing protein [Synergistaceae bacterium]
MTNPALVERIFSAASIERWNDHPHPDAFTELGKQAHKMIIAWLIAMSDPEDNDLELDFGLKKTEVKVDLDVLIECGLFEFLHRVVVTDIRPPVFHRLMRSGEDRVKLNSWVEQQLRDEIGPIPGGFAERFSTYFRDENSCPSERRVLRAAHYIATYWEFGFVQNWSGEMYGIEKTRSEINTRVWELSDIPVVQKILEASRAREGAFVSFAGQLNFQKRWAQTPRIPETSVLGHLFFVAAMSWLLSLEIGACSKRRQNNFFGGLFHDLPEVLTRDIVAPVKKSVEGLSALIKSYENEAMRERILSLLPAPIASQLSYYTQDEFENKTRRDGAVAIHEHELESNLNSDDNDPIDGKIIELCDKFAAYIECVESINNGISPKALRESRETLYDRYKGRVIYGYEASRLFDPFHTNL